MRRDRVGFERFIEVAVIGTFFVFAVLIGLALLGGLLTKAPILVIPVGAAVVYLVAENVKRRRRQLLR